MHFNIIKTLRRTINSDFGEPGGVFRLAKSWENNIIEAGITFLRQIDGSRSGLFDDSDSQYMPGCCLIMRTRMDSHHDNEII